MIKLSIEDFLFEVKEEIKCYEELGEEKAEQWEERFLIWLKDDSIKKKNIKVVQDKTFYTIGDESEIFDIVDEFHNYVQQNKVDEYWTKFQ